MNQNKNYINIKPLPNVKIGEVWKYHKGNVIDHQKGYYRSGNVIVGVDEVRSSDFFLPEDSLKLAVKRMSELVSTVVLKIRTAFDEAADKIRM